MIKLTRWDDNPSHLDPIIKSADEVGWLSEKQSAMMPSAWTFKSADTGKEVTLSNGRVKLSFENGIVVSIKGHVIPPRGKVNYETWVVQNAT
jgi:hypothetical protein